MSPIENIWKKIFLLIKYVYEKYHSLLHFTCYIISFGSLFISKPIATILMHGIFSIFFFDLPLRYRGNWSFSPSSITWSSYQCISKCCFSFSSFLKLSFSYIIQLQHCFTGFFVFFLSILFWFDLTLLAPPSSFQAKLSLWVFHSMFSQFQNFQRLIW